MVKKMPAKKATKRTATSPITTRSAKKAKNDMNDDTIEMTINQPTSAAPADISLVSQLHPVGAAQTTVFWPLILGPGNTTFSIPMQPMAQIWPATWNPAIHSYTAIPQPQLVPCMTTSATASPPVYHQAVNTSQQVFPWQTPQPMWVPCPTGGLPALTSAPTWQHPTPQWSQQAQNQPQPWQLPTLPNPPVSVGTDQQQTIAATTQQHQSSAMTTTTQPQLIQSTNQPINYIPPLLPGVVNAFQQTDLPGKPLNIIISTHVPQSVKNKVWVYNYIDLQEQFNLLPDRQTNNITLRASNNHVNITSFALWNKAFRILTKLVACKWPQLCLPMLQYLHFINEQSGKIPFQQVYAYNKKFCHQLAPSPQILWNQIDNQLQSRELHGQALWDKPGD